MFSPRRIFGEVFGSGGLFEKTFSSSCYTGWNFCESRLVKKDNASFLRRELPGWKANEITVEVKGNVLQVRGQHDKPTSELLFPISETENFKDTYPIVGRILEDKITAKLERGVLIVTIPHDKSQPVKSRRIPVTE